MKKRHLDNRCARVKHARRPFKSCRSQNVKDACELADTRISTSLCRCSDPKGFISVMKRFSHQGWRRGAKTPPAVATILFLKRHEEICPFSATLLKYIYTLSSVSIVQNLFLISERLPPLPPHYHTIWANSLFSFKYMQSLSASNWPKTAHQPFCRI